MALIDAILGAIGDTARETVSKFGPSVSDELAKAARSHVSERYPGSSHWSPSKINPGSSSSTSETARGQVRVGIEGATRAYRDVIIEPRRASALAIPISDEAKGKSPADFDGLFRPKGRNVLLMKKGNELVAMFALAQRAFQKQDPTLLPSDDQFADRVGDRFFREFDEAFPAVVHAWI